MASQMPNMSKEMISYEERLALVRADNIAKKYGYGNVIAYLKRKWADELSEKYDIPDELAQQATDVSAYPKGYDE